MPSRLLACALLLLAGCSASEARRFGKDNSLPSAVISALAHATTYELISVDPTPQREDAAATMPAAETLHGYRVLGRTTITDRQLRERLNDALRESMNSWSGLYSPCAFSPRHAIHVVRDDDSFDIMICFHCGDIVVFSDNVRAGRANVGAQPPIFNEVLTAAGIPIAK